MKKVNLLNKKLLATGLGASLLLSQLGSVNVFAEKVDAQTQTIYSDVETQTEINDILNNDKKDLNDANSEINETKNLDSEKDKETNTELNKNEVETSASDEHKKNEKTNVQTDEKEDLIKDIVIEKDKETIAKGNEKSKKEIAKKIAKYVAAAAIAGTLAYLGYRYRTPIMEKLMVSGQYISNGAKNAWQGLTKTTSKCYNSALNDTKSLWNSTTSKIATGAEKATNATLYANETLGDQCPAYNLYEKVNQGNDFLISRNTYGLDKGSFSSAKVTDIFKQKPSPKTKITGVVEWLPPKNKTTAVVEWLPPKTKTTDVVEWLPPKTKITDVVEWLPPKTKTTDVVEWLPPKTKTTNWSERASTLNNSAFSGDQVKSTKCIMGELYNKIKNGAGKAINWIVSSYKNATTTDMRGKEVRRGFII